MGRWAFGRRTVFRECKECLEAEGGNAAVGSGGAFLVGEECSNTRARRDPLE